LTVMCNSKCAYCESKIGVTSGGDIENFRPKGGAKGLGGEYAPNHYWWLAYEWENLLISCQICNQKYKRDYFPLEDETYRSAVGAKGYELLAERPLLIDPTLIDPSDHLEFDEKGFVKELSKCGKVTIEILGLNRSELIESRKNTANRLIFMLDAVGSYDPNNIESLKDAYHYIKGLFSQTKNLVAYIYELFSASPSQEYVAMQRHIFDSWYEKHGEIWDSLKATQNDNSKTIRTEKKEPSLIHESSSDIKKLEDELTSIKRFSIKTIEIENFKSIEKMVLEVPYPKESSERESWLLLLGDNGIGKSSILQAIALALSSKKQLNKLKLNVLSFLKRGAASGKIVIHSHEHDQPIILNFDNEGFRSELESAPTFVLAYGSTRLLPKGQVKPEKEREPYFNISNLFDYSVALNDPSLWLNQLDTSEFEERVAPAFFDALALRPGDKSFIENGKVMIHQFGENNDLENNSDGYKNITTLVSDIMQTLSIEKANYHNSHGIVLIDEIGNHLHPRWRMKIVSAMRKAFPKLQFIVTTHEPLCLRGLDHGEVNVLVRDQGNKIRVLDQKLLPDHNKLRIDQLLTSDLFGLINVMDDETEKTYEDYYNLLSKPTQERTEADQLKIDEYSSTLSEKEFLGSTPAMQVIYELVNETYANKMHEDGFKTVEVLKEETVKEVKEILKTKEINWL
jgi:predicted ATPase